MLSIIIPLRNEAENLAEILSHFNNSLSKIDHEVILVNDFSIDDTFKKAKKISEEYENFKIIENKKKGLGGAINVGIECCKGEKICIMMGDLSDDINDLKKYNDIMDKENIDALKKGIINLASDKVVLV